MQCRMKFIDVTDLLPAALLFDSPQKNRREGAPRRLQMFLFKR